MAVKNSNYNLPILVTGAAGRVGSVGRLVTEQLLERGFRVRAQVRVDDDRAAALGSLGADVVVGDLLDLGAAHRTGCSSKFSPGPGCRLLRCDQQHFSKGYSCNSREA
ncbi:NAD(P)H-binding protein [Terriglobus sp. YAF25]|uniref:NmrA family NAD(P)-binding protein n=1 Tax=Terriglobus sp. YAF25 TaxID=3233080 RepID=UPI003F9C0D4A